VNNLFIFNNLGPQKHDVAGQYTCLILSWLWYFGYKVLSKKPRILEALSTKIFTRSYLRQYNHQEMLLTS